VIVFHAAEVKWMENLKEQIQVHPADVLAKSLDRVSGLLGVIGQLFDVDGENFSGGNTFVAHAISTSTTLVADAKTALEDLQYSCDLTLLNGFSEDETPITMNFAEKSSLDVEPIVIREPIENSVSQYSATSPKEEQVAKTYLELLRKLTAAEVFAAEQQALSVPGSSTQLLPLLRSLREDLEKIHSAA
jgi:hypothetical protein